MTKSPKTFLVFVELPAIPGRKTKQFQVSSAVTLMRLGWIEWHSPWRRYVFHSLDAIFDAACLRDITVKLDELMEARKSQA